MTYLLDVSCLTYLTWEIRHDASACFRQWYMNCTQGSAYLKWTLVFPVLKILQIKVSSLIESSDDFILHSYDLCENVYNLKHSGFSFSTVFIMSFIKMVPQTML